MVGFIGLPWQQRLPFAHLHVVFTTSHTTNPKNSCDSSLISHINSFCLAVAVCLNVPLNAAVPCAPLPSPPHSLALTAQLTLIEFNCRLLVA